MSCKSFSNHKQENTYTIASQTIPNSSISSNSSQNFSASQSLSSVSSTTVSNNQGSVNSYNRDVAPIINNKKNKVNAGSNIEKSISEKTVKKLRDL